MLRVVFDTNIYISAFVFGGSTEQLIRLAEDGVVLTYISPAIVRETRRIMQTKFGWNPAQMTVAMRKLKRIGHVVNLRFRLQVLSDRADNRILECAVAAKADVIVSGDIGLQKLVEYEGIVLLSPKQFIDQYTF